MSINTHGTIPSVRNHNLHHYLPQWGDVLIRLSCFADARPVRYFAGLLIASALAYVTLAVAFTPSAALRRATASYAGSESRKPSRSWASPSSVGYHAAGNSSFNGRPDATAS